MYSGENHTFAVCAYKQSPYLEECIRSIRSQKVKSNVILSTSTPNHYIEGIARKYELPVYVNPGPGGIAGDWNFAYASARTELVTLAHQDDRYEENYTQEILKNINKSKRPLIAFSDYKELRNGRTIEKNRLLLVKKILLSPLRLHGLWGSVWTRRRILSLGSAICAPSVTLVKENLPPEIFQTGMKSNIDWEAWERLSKYKGSFVYCARPLMSHRIHPQSTTTDIIKGGQRRLEDLEMFERFWPKWFANIWEKLYSNGEKSNRI